MTYSRFNILGLPLFKAIFSASLLSGVGSHV